MKVSLTKHFDRYGAEKIASGRYANASEIVQEALRQMEEREQGDESPTLQAKIAAGFNTPLKRVTRTGWKSKWKDGLALAEKLNDRRTYATPPQNVVLGHSRSVSGR